MKTDVESSMVELMTKFINTVAVNLPDDVYEKLLELSKREVSSTGRFIYSAMLKNLELASLRKSPLCQDTGILEFYVTLGEMFPHKSLLLKSIREATIRSTKHGFLRPNVVDPISDKNTGDNTGRLIPWIETEIGTGSDYADVKLYLAGGGASRPGVARVLDPAEGFEGLVKFVLSVVAEYGPPACPPLMVVGVGIGPTVEIAAELSKRALLRPLGTRSPESRVAKLEEALVDAINKLGIGPQGLGGSTTVGEVHVEYAGRHPATFAVGVNTACWALRKGWIRVNSDLTYQLLSHRGGLVE